MAGNAWLADLSVGDKVILRRGVHGAQLATVKKLTKTLFVLSSGDRVRRRDGTEPGKGWYKSHILPATEKAVSDLRAEVARRRNAAKLRGTNWDKMPADKLARVLAVLDGDES